MIEACDKLRDDFLASQVGSTEAVLVERMRNTGECEGYTSNYTPVKFKGSKELCSQIIDIHITGVDNDFCTGEITRVTEVIRTSL